MAINRISIQLLLLLAPFRGATGQTNRFDETVDENIVARRLPEAIKPNSAMCRNITVSEHLIARDIFGKYQTWVRPLRNSSKPMEVEIRLVLSSINDVYWYDELHTWNNLFPHACVASVTLPQRLLWIPEIAMINSEQHYELLLMYEQEQLRVSSNGYVSYRPGGTFKAFCDFDLRLFPFDSQNCTLIMESWRYTVEFQVFRLGDVIQQRWWIENEQWTLASTDQRVKGVRYVIPTNVFSRVEFDLVMKRKTGYYLVNVIVPSLIISLAEVASFTSAVDDSMKLELSFTCLLAYGVFQLMIIDDIPRTSDRIPILCYYIDLSMLYICLAMIGEGVVFVCYRKSRDKRRQQEVPGWIYKICLVAAHAFCVKKPRAPKTKEQVTDHYRSLTNDYVSMVDHLYRANNGKEQRELFGSEIEHKERAQAQEVYRVQRWEFVADVMDRFVLFSYVFLISITPVFLFYIVPNNRALFYSEVTVSV